MKREESGDTGESKMCRITKMDVGNVLGMETVLAQSQASERSHVVELNEFQRSELVWEPL